MTKKELKQVDEMMIEILQHLNDMLTDEDCEHYIKLTAENATVFFTALNNAVCATLSKFTDDCTNYIEAQHMFNKLLIQYIIDSKMYEGEND